MVYNREQLAQRVTELEQLLKTAEDHCFEYEVKTAELETQILTIANSSSSNNGINIKSPGAEVTLHTASSSSALSRPLPVKHFEAHAYSDSKGVQSTSHSFHVRNARIGHLITVSCTIVHYVCLHCCEVK